jgi:alcohol dehydrogenase
LYAGLAISECRTSLSHSISYPLTYTFGLPHGIACAFTLPAIAEYVLKNKILPRELSLNNEASNLLFNSHKYFNQIFSKHGVKELFSEFVSSKSEVLALIPEMHHPDRAVNFPIQVTSGDIFDIIEKSLDMIYN